MDALKPMDTSGGPLPKRLGPFPVLGVAVRAGLPMRPVPPEYWRPATDLANHLQAVIDCQCGQSVIAELIELKPCPGCSRWFFFTGPDVLALNTPSPSD